MEVSRLCFICFREVSLNSNEIVNSGLGGKFATSSYEYLSLSGLAHGGNEVNKSEDDFGAVCSECELTLEAFCGMHAQLQDLQKKLNAKVEKISQVMTKAESEIERKEEFEAYQRFWQLQQNRRGQRFVDVTGFRKDFVERVQNRNLVSQPYPVGNGSVSSGSCNSNAHTVVDTNSPSSHSRSPLLDSPTSRFVNAQSAHQPSHDDSTGSGIQNSSFSPIAAPADSKVARKNEDVTSKSHYLRRPSAPAIAEKPLFDSSNSTGKPPFQKRGRRNSQRIRISDYQKKCVFCDKYFKSFTYLVRHLQSHIGERWHGCKICGKEFSQRSHLIRHSRIHTGERLYKCEICEKRLKSREGLEGHIRLHTLEKPFKCRFCKKEFSHRSNCKSHETIHERRLAK